LIRARKFTGIKCSPLKFDSSDLVEPRSSEDTSLIARMDAETIQAARFSVGMKWNLI